MKTIGILALVLAGSLGAATTGTVTTIGPWPICEQAGSDLSQVLSTGQTLGEMFCTGFVAGHETYSLFIQSDSPDSVIGFRYTVTGYGVHSGRLIRKPGVVQRGNHTTIVLEFTEPLDFRTIQVWVRDINDIENN